MAERITSLTTSQVKCFKQCRKKYELEYVECLKPIETPKAFQIGTLFHFGLECLQSGKTIDDAIMDMQLECETDAILRQVDVNYYDLFTAQEMVRAWNEQSNWRSWNVVAVERTFEVSTGYAKRLKGKIDGIIIHPQTGKPYLQEHKTTSQWGEEYLHNLLWDEQPTNYLYAFEKMRNSGEIDLPAADGIFYDITEKPKIKPYLATPVDKRKYTKDGKLYAGQHETDETPEAYAIRVREWYTSGERVHTAYVYRTPEDIQAQIDDFNLTLKDIQHAEKDKVFYRNPECCKILPCPYRAKCLDNVPDTDCLFVKKTAKNEEL